MLALALFVAAADSRSVPLGLDVFVPVPEDNPMKVEKVDLGRRLFNDRRLSHLGPLEQA